MEDGTMTHKDERIVCNLKALRRSRRLSQSELAGRVGVKRQAIYDMETNRYMPNTALALRLARELGCRVEDLFALNEPDEDRPVTLVEKTGRTISRVSVARVRERLIAYPLDGRWMMSDGFQAADGLLQDRGDRVHLLAGPDCLDQKILLLGCDPAFAVLGAHMTRLAGGATLHCRFASSQLALERLADGYAHIAGTHLHNNGPGEANVRFARDCLKGCRGTVVAFSSFEEGLMVAPGNPLHIRSVADLAGGRVRFVNRERGAALRTLLDDRLAQAGVDVCSILGYDHLLSSHNQCAQMVVMNMADAAMGLRAVASAYELDFIPMEAVRCDLVIPSDLLELAAIQVLLDVLQSRALRDELAALPGYESSSTGRVIGEF
jgi:molybdate-binding protein/DNA-binding XRE family transcriptional regulator